MTIPSSINTILNGQTQPDSRLSIRSCGFQLSPIKEIELHVSKTPGAISLAQGIPYVATPKEVTDYVKQKIDEGRCDKYSLSPGLEELREELALSLREDGTAYDPEREIIVTAGSIEGMTATLLSLINRGEEVLIPSPTYASYIGSVLLSEGIPKYIPLREDTGFDIVPELFEQQITKKTKAILLCTPNNPTGTVYSKESLEALLRLAVERDLYIIVDEVYKDFYFSNAPHISPASYPWARDHLIRVCSFSKAYAMTGWRVGFLAAPKHIAGTLLKVHDVMVSCAPVVSQYAAIGALRFGDEARLRFIEEFKLRRDLTIQYLDQMSEWLDYQVPQATYFAFPRVKDTIPLARESRKLVYDILEKQKVAFVEGAAFGPSGESHFRINFGRSEETLVQGMERLGAYFSESARSTHLRTQQESQTAPTTESSSLPLSTRLFLSLAKLGMRNRRGTVIGIVGSRGKTVVRRVLTSSLGKSEELLSSHLSHNTLFGLALSLLGLTAPQNRLEKLLTLLNGITTAIQGSKSKELYILEYGIQRSDEVPHYVDLIKPDYLVVTSGIGFERNIKKEEVLDGLKLLCKKSSPKKVLIPDDEEWLIERLELSPKLVEIAPLPTDNYCGRSDGYGRSFATLLTDELRR